MGSSYLMRIVWQVDLKLADPIKRSRKPDDMDIFFPALDSPIAVVFFCIAIQID